jgi:hypothetical protein
MIALSGVLLMNLKTLIVVAIIVGILFALSVGIGIRNDNSNSQELDFFNAPWVQNIKQRFTSKLDVAEIDAEQGAPAGCSQEEDQLIIPADPDTLCLFVIQASDEDGKTSVRTLPLRLVAGTSVTLKLEQPESEDALTVNKDLIPNENVSLDVYETGGVLSLTNCVSPDEETDFSNCVVEIK